MKKKKKKELVQNPETSNLPHTEFLHPTSCSCILLQYPVLGQLLSAASCAAGTGAALHAGSLPEATRESCADI